MTQPGPVAFVGGLEWRDGCAFDAELLEASGGGEVLVLPTAAAYEWPKRAVESASAYFENFGATVRGLDVLQRRDAEKTENIEAVHKARFIYLADGSPLHLRSVLKGSSLWTALVEAWQSGAVVAGSSAGAMILGDPMVDPRGGAFTLGLGLISQLAIVPHRERWTGDKARRMTQLIPRDVVVAEIEERTALIRWDKDRWELSGPGSVTLTLNSEPIELEKLAN